MIKSIVQQAVRIAETFGEVLRHPCMHQSLVDFLRLGLRTWPVKMIHDLTSRICQEE